MDVKASVIDAIGNTPLIRLRRASELTGCEIYGKAEFLNPGQSVKDRAALFIIRDAVARGELRPGGVIVEGTAGNTGIGLALVGRAMGYRSVIVIPDNQSQEKKDALRLAGATLIEVPPAPYRDPNNYVKVSGRLAEQLADERAGRRHLGQPVRQRRQPPGAHRDHRAGDLAADRRQGRRLHLRRRHRRHARRHGDGPAREEPEDRHRPRRPEGRGAVFLLHHRQRSTPRARRSPRASARAASPATSKG